MRKYESDHYVRAVVLVDLKPVGYPGQERHFRANGKTRVQVLKSFSIISSMPYFLLGSSLTRMTDSVPMRVLRITNDAISKSNSCIPPQTQSNGVDILLVVPFRSWWFQFSVQRRLQLGGEVDTWL